MDIGKSIKIAIAMKGINQKELAARSGVSETTISLAVTKKNVPTLGTMQKIAKATNMTYLQLIALGE